MHKAFNRKSPYNLQGTFLSERTDYETKTSQSSSLDKVMYTQQHNNTVFQLQVLHYGIALKKSLEIAKLNKFLRQFFLITYYVKI